MQIELAHLRTQGIDGVRVIGSVKGRSGGVEVGTTFCLGAAAQLGEHVNPELERQISSFWISQLPP